MRINFGLAFLALVISLALWVLVVNDQNPEREDTPDIPIPVEITKLPSGLVMMNTIDPVRFRIRAPKDRWDGIRVSGFRALVDLSRVHPGIQQVPVIPEASDPQIRILDVMPAMVSVRIDEIRERTVPVKVNLIGNVPFGYVYGRPTVEPEMVTVVGPASLVEGVETVSVDVRVEGITVAIDSMFHPTPMDSSVTLVENVRTNPQTVRVQLPVEQQVSYKQVGVRATVDGEVSSGYWIESVSAEPSSVTVVGDPRVLADIDYLETATLDVSGASSSITRDLRILMPQGASSLQQQTTRVTVNVSSLDASQSLRVAPVVANLDPKLQVASAPSFIDITLQGSAPLMKSVNLDAIKVTLNAQDLGEGSHTVRPSITTPPGVSTAAVSPETVTLVLRPVDLPTPTPTPAGSPSPAPAGAATATPTANGGQ